MHIPGTGNSPLLLDKRVLVKDILKTDATRMFSLHPIIGTHPFGPILRLIGQNQACAHS